jgi:cell wall-associated NlpC family hydrolase
MTQPQPQEPDPVKQTADERSQLGIRGQLLHTLASSPTGKDLAQVAYGNLGINANVRLQGVQSPIGELQPGDLVGWSGGHKQDGSYVGNLAIYAGDGHIVEQYYGGPRRRKLNDNEDVFGMPVYHLED